MNTNMSGNVTGTPDKSTWSDACVEVDEIPTAEVMMKRKYHQIYLTFINLRHYC